MNTTINRIPVRIKLVHDAAQLPKAATFGDAGFDVRSIAEYTIRPGETRTVLTGIAIEIPPHTFAAICSRSGLAAKHSVAVLNAPGILDSGYRGEVMVVLHNFGVEPFKVAVGDRVAQLVIQEYLAPDWEVVDDLSGSERGVGGGGHTGVK